MTCRKLRRWLPLYVGGELRPRRSLRLEAHLRRCAYCRRETESFRKDLEAVRNELSSPPYVWREPAWRRAVIQAAGSRSSRPVARRPVPRRIVWAYALLALLAAGLSFLVLAPLPEGGAGSDAFSASFRDRAASGGRSPASAAPDQHIVSMTLVSRETGLKVQWFLNRNFSLKEDIE